MKKRNIALMVTIGVVLSGLSIPHASAKNNLPDFPSNVISAEKFNEKIGSPEFKSGLLTEPSSKDPESIVLDYFNANKNVYKFGKGSADASFKIISQEKDEFGNTIVRLQQMYNGVPVFGSTQVGHVNKKGVLTVVSGSVIPDLDKQANLNAVSKQNEKDIVSIAQKDLGYTPTYTQEPKVQLVVYTHEKTATYAYQVSLHFLSPKPGNYDYFIEAKTGKILNKYNKIQNPTKIKKEEASNKSVTIQESSLSPDLKTITGTATTGTGIGVLGDTKTLNMVKSTNGYYLQDNTRGKGIFTYNAKNNTTLPGSLWVEKTNKYTTASDRAAVDAHFYAGVVYDYYKKTFNRNSYDNNGAALKSTVHYDQNYDNAFWDGTEMVYGDGDGTMFTALSGGIDVIGHELTHAVTERTSNLTYQDEPGALNEAISDIFGTLIEFSYKGNKGNYDIGEDVYTPNIPGDALRSMSDPTKYGDPDNYTDRYTGTDDNGGVHTNSGIINKAAYLLAEGGTSYGVTVPGIGRDKLGKIYYRANTTYFTESTTFSQARAALMQAAADLYGSTSAEVNAVTLAYDAVGVE